MRMPIRIHQRSLIWLPLAVAESGGAMPPFPARAAGAMARATIATASVTGASLARIPSDSDCRRRRRGRGSARPSIYDAGRGRGLGCTATRDRCTSRSRSTSTGILQQRGADYGVEGRELHFLKPLAKEGRLGTVRWLSMLLGVAGSVPQERLCGRRLRGRRPEGRRNRACRSFRLSLPTPRRGRSPTGPSNLHLGGVSSAHAVGVGAGPRPACRGRISSGPPNLDRPRRRPGVLGSRPGGVGAGPRPACRGRISSGPPNLDRPRRRRGVLGSRPVGVGAYRPARRGRIYSARRRRELPLSAARG